ncbi:MAG TPA: ribonuclease E/G [Rhizomicrobium sp.]|nr:ribonuclease E/G [Rhizomicrobium sp.]
MPKRMLIDASHPEETRVVVLDGQKVEEFDFEAASKRPLKGNIYLAKVTRVEPSLQAAFVEYGGNRQGFLAFSEIHPDYYQIPVADRLALLAEQEADARRRQDDEFESFDTATAPAKGPSADDAEGDSERSDEEESEDQREDEAVEAELEDDDAAESVSFASADVEPPPAPTIPEASIPEDTMAEEIAAEQSVEDTENAAGESVVEEVQSQEESQRAQTAGQRPAQRWMRRRHYKIQEVIKRRQVILVQVVKEERGNKGAALTTYLSLAGRYCVLMPNTPRGGGISRKITNANDRKRLKSAAQALELPEGMGLIIRTAGENRTKVEIKRDYEYLLRMWDTIRDITLKSNAPACVYEEGDLIKRAIRDLYNKDVSEIIVEGEDGYRNAKDFMRMLMPSHAKNVKPYKEPIPLYQRLHIEAQLDAMFSPTVTLRSGGYIVINQTEALVAVDVNSGRATREHSIEDTAYKTNLEAAEEVARQLRLRDLAGLIVIDFIDMEDGRNDRNVEKRLRDCVKNDRARVQIGKISQFGLLEMSRQRLRAGVVAGSTVPCPTCAGQGIVRSVESTALRVLRALDEEGQRQRANTLVIHAPVEVAMYTLNQKRREIARMEQDYAVTIAFQPKDDMQAGTFDMERIGQRAPEERAKTAPPITDAPLIAVQVEDEGDDFVEEPEEQETAEGEVETTQASQPEAQPNGEGGGRRRRRRRRRGRDRTQPPDQPQNPAPASFQPSGTSEGAEGDDEDDDHAEGPQGEHHEQPQGAAPNGEGGRRRRRRRRRGRRGGQREGGNPNFVGSGDGIEGVPVDASTQDGDVTGGDVSDTSVISPALNAPSAPLWSLASEKRQEMREEPIARIDIDVPANVADEPVDAAPAITAEAVRAQISEAPRADEPQTPARKGWWQRPFRLRE